MEGASKSFHHPWVRPRPLLTPRSAWEPPEPLSVALTICKMLPKTKKWRLPSAAVMVPGPCVCA